jgi:16S rRNA pseudouridine516 synthase
MASGSHRLDRYFSKTLGINRRDVKALLAQGRILIDHQPAVDAEQLVDEFSHIAFDERVLQLKLPVYLMLHKPIGILSATTDPRLPTVIDLLQRADKGDLHIVGRLDRGSSGLLLLTNDGRWSRALMAPEREVPKVYLVTVQNPLTPDYVKAFSDGMYFAYEGITTRPARLEILEERLARVTLVEGRYHQIKRMFGRFRNPVLALHRTAIGNLPLDPELAPGQSRELTPAELKGIRG